MNTYAIGDIQGCFSEFIALLEKVNFNKDDDQLWLVGDLINRGPQNLETILFLKSLPNVTCVLGNHDLHFLAVATGVHKASKSDTLHDLLASPDLPEIIEWLRHLPLIHLNPSQRYLMVHAGLPSIWSSAEALSYADEVHTVLRGDNYQTFLKAMYGNQPAIWSSNLKGMDRLRVITNYLTRLRYCKVDGEMDLIHKDQVIPLGFDAWFDHHPEVLENDMTILFGHWAALQGVTGRKNILALDTGCLWGRQLTAFRLEDKQFFSVPSQQTLAKFNELKGV